MPHIAIINDTDSSLPGVLIACYQVYLVPLTIHFGEQSYEAVVDIDVVDKFRPADRDGRLDLLNRFRTL